MRDKLGIIGTIILLAIVSVPLLYTWIQSDGINKMLTTDITDPASRAALTLDGTATTVPSYSSFLDLVGMMIPYICVVGGMAFLGYLAFRSFKRGENISGE